jgi:hypothetical protein
MYFICLNTVFRPLSQTEFLFIDLEVDETLPPTEEIQVSTCIEEEPTHAAAVKWVVDPNFKADHRVKIPEDPKQW